MADKRIVRVLVEIAVEDIPDGAILADPLLCETAENMVYDAMCAEEISARVCQKGLKKSEDFGPYISR